MIKKQQSVKKKKAKLYVSEKPRVSKKGPRTSSMYANDLTAPSVSSGPGMLLPPKSGKPSTR